MKATLEFDLYDLDDREQHTLALNGRAYSMFICDYWNQVLREFYKHGVPERLNDNQKLIEYMRDKFVELLHDRGLKLDE